MQRDIHKEIILRCQEGDRKAQSELYHLYAKAMYNICRRMVADDDEAKDILQDAFVDAFIQIKKLKDINFFSAWIKRITINKCLNAMRKRKIFALSLDEGEEVQEYVDAVSDQDLVQTEAAKIMQAIEHLAPGSRAVLNLFLFEGYDHKEIAQILNITEGASKSQYSKAKQKIRHIINLQNTTSYGNG
ncbi:RNA polymerase sigma factor [Reichenbachiella sp. 5M10]|uniref:RNA polymerase sigma factor n=1 Tax=Reichenbachiella sp. 5M10 TaxID=1889772 RepID=UPI001303F8D4|nr:sigma-70 family RNA polymerase sigma factor [Reichenbachiella sp. 5M10]